MGMWWEEQDMSFTLPKCVNILTLCDTVYRSVEHCMPQVHNFPELDIKYKS